MIFREGLDRLIHSRKFWLAVLAMIQTIVFQFFPSVDQAVWLSINGVIVALITAITIDDIVEGAQVAEKPVEPPSELPQG